MAEVGSLLLVVALLCGGMNRSWSFTDPQDVAVLQSLRGTWVNAPPSWGKSDDPCGVPWEGITCNNSRVTALGLSGIGIKGQLGGDIGGLTQLGSLDLSYNPELTGPLSPRLGDLQNLHILILAGCGFTGTIPSELGNLSELTFIALNNNKLTGPIPPSLGKLSKLYWLDLAENQLSGPIPVSNETKSGTTPGLDQLIRAKHFHFNKNQLSGPIPERLFSSDMILIHVLLDSNQLNGAIPSTLGLVNSLEALRLDRNALSGGVPSNLNNLTSLTELNLANNGLTGPLPDLSDMNALNYVDLSNNSFDPSFAPIWFSNLPSVNTIVIEHGSLKGLVPEQIFGLPQIQQVKLRNNAFSGVLNMTGDAIASDLQLIDLENNEISSVELGDPGYSNTLTLIGNPVCETTTSSEIYCQIQQGDKPYSTSLTSCGTKNCPADRKLSPQSCSCSFPYEGVLIFRAPSFRELSDVTLFQALESSLWKNLELPSGSVFLENPFFNIDDYLQIQVALFPTSGKSFNRTEILRIGFAMNNQNFKPPPKFGPYLFIASPYTFPGHRGRMTMGMIVAVTVCGTMLVLGLIAVGIYAVWQKRRAEKAIGLSRPFASWVASVRDSGGAPQLKGARWFSYEELKKCTNNFSESNEIGSGGYGKVYKGTLSDGHTVAIKRAQKGSMQGSMEFKTEIELLSRVHHKNLVNLVGFSFEQGDQMLVYDYIPNGTLRASLSGKSGIHLDWRRRLRVALSSARGLSYLHDLADPPIIHRDIKSTNILLDENLTAKVADFGLSKLVSDSEKGHVSTQVKGTLGYLDPEYYMTQQLTDKSDVYSFGVVMLELITAKPPIEKGKYIVREIRNTMDVTDEDCYGLKDMIDPTIKNTNYYLIGFGRFLRLAMQCVEESASSRPSMSEVVKIIEIILHDEGLSTNSTSASSSSTDFGRYPYDGVLPHKDKSGDTSSSKIDPQSK